MRPKHPFLLLLLACSLIVNAGQLTRLLRPSAGRDRAKTAPANPAGTPSAQAAWHVLYNTDAKLFAHNLREAGVPKHWIQAVVFSEIDRSFRAREEAIVPTKALKFWQKNTSILSLQTSLALLDLRREKARLKLELFGPGAILPDPLSPYNIAPAASREMVQLIKEDYDTMIQALRQKAGYLFTPGDREQILYVEAEKLRELRAYLSDEEIATLDMRTSRLAEELRTELRFLPMSEAEFVAIYETRKALEKSSRPSEGEPRASGQDQQTLKADLAAKLGTDRYKAYVRAKEFEYRHLQSLVTRTGLPVSAGDQAWDLREVVSAESNRIFEDPKLNKVQKHAALKALANDTRARYAALLGAEAGAAYGRAGWLKALEKGAVVWFKEQGYSYRELDPSDD